VPESLTIPTHGPLDATIRVPGSKSITNRALLIAGLAEGETTLRGPLHSDDTDVMRTALEALGARIEVGEDCLRVRGTGAQLQGTPKDTALYTGNSGTTARFITAATTLGRGPCVIDGNQRMRERPIQDLVDALAQLGAEIEVQGRGGCPPLLVRGGGLPGGNAVIDASNSSQYVSAVLLASPYAATDVSLSFVDGVLVSRPYVDLTLEVMRAFGAEAGWRDDGSLRVAAGVPYRARDYRIEPDASSAVYPFCAAAIAGGTTRVEGIPQDSLQADFAILPLLERMGCRVTRERDFTEVRGPEAPLRSLGTLDMNALPDAALAMAVVALFADGPTVIENIANLRIKETDRLAALETELRRMGARAEAGPDWLRVEPGPLRGAEIETYDDHRMAMSFALAGLRVPGVVIRDPGCVSKTWPNFFDVFGHL
jgi:3-phosphoshikimate 1-carboxyvinyltransferase